MSVSFKDWIQKNSNLRLILELFETDFQISIIWEKVENF
jgi:hypothetical protein